MLELAVPRPHAQRPVDPEHGVAEGQGSVRWQLERDLGAPRPPDRVRAHAAVERLATAQRPEGGAVVEPRGAVFMPEDRDLVPVAPAPPQKLRAADVEGGGDEDA